MPSLRLSPTRFAPRAALGILAGVLAAVLPGQAAAQFVPNETRASGNPGLIDFEFSQTRGRFVWTDTDGKVWLGRVNRATGDFEPASGKGLLVATGAITKSNMFKFNGPEWLAMASGDQILYSYYRPGLPQTTQNTRMAVAVQNRQGEWVSQPLSPELPRIAHVASQDKGDTNPRIRYLDPDLNHYVRDVLEASTEVKLTFLPPSTRAWRFASGARALLYSAPANGVSQVFSYQLDSGQIKQMTFDEGDKDTGRSVPWMWQAPEFGGDYVFATVVDESELRVYRKLPTGPGTTAWKPIYSAALPPGRTIGSPEWFVYNGKSYLSLAVFITPNEFPSEVWVSNIVSADPLFRRITDSTVFRVRNDPEVFITDQGPYVYYNRYDPNINPDHPLCNSCSEGVYRADAGLWGR
jgi:hypothetical protein